VVALAALLLSLPGPPTAEARAGVASAYPVLPVADDGRFFASLGVGPVAPGASTELAFALVDPLAPPVTQVSVRFEVYAFNPYPGRPGGAALPADPPLLEAAGSAARSVTVGTAALAPGARWSVPVRLTADGGVPEGTYAIRVALAFRAGGVGYLLESKGFFSAEQWNRSSANGTAPVDPAVLGVSGVVPETAVLVRATAGVSATVYALVGAAVVFAGLGGYYALRGPGPGSRSGRRASEPAEKNAPMAFGKRRRRAGD
jgi:hypothetical protein